MIARTSPAQMPKHAVILCHPDPDSFNGAVARRYCETVEQIGHSVILRDLYRIGFDPVLKVEEQPTAENFVLAEDVATELELLNGVNVLVLVYPLWFAMPPAMLKGYVDRVLGAGFPYGAIRQSLVHPLLTGCHLLSFTSSGTAKQWLQETGAWSSLRQLFDEYLRHAFSLQSADHVHFSSIVPGMKPRFVEEYLFQVEQMARKMCAGVAAKLENPMKG
jgi:NAD(P)H dehydrogenase (quinone)